MSDYISKSALVEKFEERMKDDNVMCPIVKVLDVLEIIDDAPTLDEKEIIRKPMERIIERLEGQKEHSSRIYDNLKDSFYLGMQQADDNAIEIVKEEGGIE